MRRAAATDDNERACTRQFLGKRNQFGGGFFFSTIVSVSAVPLWTAAEILSVCLSRSVLLSLRRHWSCWLPAKNNSSSSDHLLLTAGLRSRAVGSISGYTSESNGCASRAFDFVKEVSLLTITPIYSTDQLVVRSSSIIFPRAVLSVRVQLIRLCILKHFPDFNLVGLDTYIWFGSKWRRQSDQWMDGW